MDYYFNSIYMARIFLALSIEKDLNDQIIEIKKELKNNLLKDEKISWQRNDHHHLTVYFIGEMEPEQITQLNQDLSTINLKGIPKSIDLTAVTFFPAGKGGASFWGGGGAAGGHHHATGTAGQHGGGGAGGREQGGSVAADSTAGGAGIIVVEEYS